MRNFWVPWGSFWKIWSRDGISWMDASKGSLFVSQKLTTGTSFKSLWLNEGVLRQLGWTKQAWQSRNRKTSTIIIFHLENRITRIYVIHAISWRERLRASGRKTDSILQLRGGNNLIIIQKRQTKKCFVSCSGETLTTKFNTIVSWAFLKARSAQFNKMGFINQTAGNVCGNFYREAVSLSSLAG